MRSILIIVAVTALLTGCSRPTPTLAGGKPVEFWVKQLQSGDAKARRQAAAKLGNVGPADPAVLPALRSALNDADALVRAEAIRSLARCGPAAKDSVAELEQLQAHDADATVRDCAAKALAHLR
jgi:HEAT repeat protein